MYVGTWLGLTGIDRKIGRSSPGLLSDYRALTFISAVPTLAWLGAMLRNVNEPTLIDVSAALVLLFHLMTLLYLSSTALIRQGRLCQSALQSVALLALSYAGGAGGCAVISWLFPGWTERLGPLASNVVGLAGLLSFLGTAAWLTLTLLGARHTAGRLGASLHSGLVAAQPPVLVGAVALIPLPWLTASGLDTGLRASPVLVGLVLGFIALGLRSVWLSRRQEGAGVSLWTLSSLLAMIHLSYPGPHFLPADSLLRNYFGVPVLPTDDYHFGEMNVPWQSLWVFHQTPYGQYTPPHGLIDYLPGLASAAFFDGSPSSILAATTVVSVGVMAATFFALAPIIGRPLAFLALLAVGTLPLPYLLIVLALCTLYRGFNTGSRTRWLLKFLLWSCGLVLLAPAQGAAFVLALLPLTLLVAYRAVRDAGEHARLRRLALLVLVVTAATALSPARQVVWGVARYTLENSALNLTAYGLPWAESDSGLVTLRRHLWLPVLVLAILSVVRNWRRSERRDLLVLQSGALILLPLLPYTLGRIDSSGLSRPGTMSLLAVAVLLPFLLRGTGVHWLYRAAAVAWCVSLVSLPEVVQGFSVSQPFTGMARPAALEPNRLVTTDTLGGRLGRVYADSQQLARLTEISAVLARVLTPDQTYLDLTNRGANYGYLGRRVPVLAGAVYNLAGTQEQKRAVQALQADPPPVVLASADNIVPDGLPLSLRTPVLYRYLMERYRPVTVNGFLWLVDLNRPQLMESLTHGSPAAPSAVPQPTAPQTAWSEAQLQQVEAALSTADLQALPVAWGRSLRSLSAQMVTVAELTPEVRETHAWTLRPGPAGDQADLLGFRLLCAPTSASVTSTDPVTVAEPVPLTVSWTGEVGGAGTVRGSLKFLALPQGRVLVPLDAAPRWLLTRSATQLRVEWPQHTGCAASALGELALYRRAAR